MDLLKTAVSLSLSDPQVADAVRQVPDLAAKLTASLDRALRATCGGNRLYIPGRASRADLASRDEALRRAHTGRNLSELAAAHGISERRARQILDPRRRKK